MDATKTLSLSKSQKILNFDQGFKMYLLEFQLLQHLKIQSDFVIYYVGPLWLKKAQNILN